MRVLKCSRHDDRLPDRHDSCDSWTQERLASTHIPRTTPHRSPSRPKPESHHTTGGRRGTPKETQTPKSGGSTTPQGAKGTNHLGGGGKVGGRPSRDHIDVTRKIAKGCVQTHAICRTATLTMLLLRQSLPDYSRLEPGRFAQVCNVGIDTSMEQPAHGLYSASSSSPLLRLRLGCSLNTDFNQIGDPGLSHVPRLAGGDVK